MSDENGEAIMPRTKVVSQEEWLVARNALLVKEKELTRLRDELSRERRNLPRVWIEKEYVFDTPSGKATLSDLFDGRSQLVIYHFMFGPDWEEGCKSCSFWADNFNGIVVHLKQRDVTLIAVSRSALGKIEAFKRRMGWSFTWVSSFGCDFNRDFHVSFTPQDISSGRAFYNYAIRRALGSELPGISVFLKDDSGAIYHTYSTYARGLDLTNTAYNFLDLTPKGRDEGHLDGPMSWVRHHDRYDPHNRTAK
jgi:predicted dithiol-disulfide oxidoreductase (DUF899 family)